MYPVRLHRTRYQLRMLIANPSGGNTLCEQPVLTAPTCAEILIQAVVRIKCLTQS